VIAVARARRSAGTGLRRVVPPVAGGLGRLLGRPLAALARWRSGKPMHPRGVVRDAVLERTGSSPPWGVPWLDHPGRDRALVRLSRGAGLPPPWPDVLGLAVRVPGPDGERVELLLSTTGRGRLSRVLPVPRRHPAATYGSIMGYRTDAGTLRLAAMGERTASGNGEGLVFVLAAARGTGPWRPFARLTLGGPVDPPDPDVRFDAVLHPPPGLVADGPLAHVRAPAYARARAGRDAARQEG
jgi:hypothetical protein